MAVYLFFDESGNLDFSPNGSRHFCFGVLTLRDPGPLTSALTRLRYSLLGEGLELELFHAAEDRQAVRDRVFATLGEVGGFELDLLVADKRQIHPALRDPFEFYCHHGYAVMEAALTRVRHLDETIVVITDTLPIQRDRKALAKAFRMAIRRLLGDRRFQVLHHASAAHAGLAGGGLLHVGAAAKAARRRAVVRADTGVDPDGVAGARGRDIKSDLPSYPF